MNPPAQPDATSYELADEPQGQGSGASESNSTETPTRKSRGAAILLGLTTLLCVAHAYVLLLGFGGWSGLASEWPLAWHDHPMHFHNAVITRAFLAESWTTAGYDPSFMAGYAKSIVSDPSSTLVEAFVAATPFLTPAVGYKLIVWLSGALGPVLMAIAAWRWGGRSVAVFSATLLEVVYLWTDFGSNYLALGMFAHVLVVPAALLAIEPLTRFLELGGRARWLAATLGMALVALIHPLAATIVVPTIFIGYGVWLHRGLATDQRVAVRRTFALLALSVVVVALNAWWWLPGFRFRSTQSLPELAFYHPEPLLARLAQIVGLSRPVQPEVQAVSLGLGFLGLAALRAHRGRVAVAILGGWVVLAFVWGYLAAAVPAFRGIQPGRQTYALYTATCLLAGLGVEALLHSLRRLGGWWPGITAGALILVAIRLFAAPTLGSMQARVAGPVKFLSSEPTPEFRWILKAIQTHFEPGDRLLYEEGGRDLRKEESLPAEARVPDIFSGRRYSGLLPTLTGVELLGGPFLFVPVETRFTQFGEGRLFTKPAWVRAWFEEYARIYGPVGILCWSEHARKFCRANPDLIQVVAEDPSGNLLVGRIKGFEGRTIVGAARVSTKGGRLTVDIDSVDVDGRVILRYHTAPGMRSMPPVPLGSVPMGDDPVPFLEIRPPSEIRQLTLDLDATP